MFLLKYLFLFYLVVIKKVVILIIIKLIFNNIELIIIFKTIAI